MPQAVTKAPDRFIAQADSAVQVEGLSYSAGFVRILKDIRFSLKSGQVLALLGPNGAGKSTLLKCLAGLLVHNGSRLLFGSSRVTDPDIKRKVAYLGHETFLYLKLTPKENLRFYSKLYGRSADVDRILEEYGLKDYADQPVETFSRGMKQRLALARTQLAEPELLLLDEPFTGLDQASGHFLEKKILQLKGNSAVIMATHEMDRAEKIADVFLILRNGRQIFLGPKEGHFASLAELYEEKVNRT